MRVWDVHPGYLSRSSLLGQHVEIHALISVLSGNKKGYRSHPETLRWEGHLGKLQRRHDLTVKEMELRGFRHNSPCELNDYIEASPERLSYVDHPVEQFALLGQKYLSRLQEGRIPLAHRGSDFWAHHSYSVMARGCSFHDEIHSYVQQENDLFIREEGNLVDRVLAILERPVIEKDLLNVVNILWSIVNKETPVPENEQHSRCPQNKLPVLLGNIYRTAQQYGCRHLLHSTIFADHID